MVSSNSSGNGMATIAAPALVAGMVRRMVYITPGKPMQNGFTEKLQRSTARPNASMRRCSRGGPCPLRARRLAARLQSRQAAQNGAGARLKQMAHAAILRLASAGAANAYHRWRGADSVIAESVPRTSLPRSGIRDLYLICSSGERRSRTAVRIIIAIDSITNPVLHTICRNDCRRVPWA